MPCHYSWVRVLYDFIRDPSLGPQSRIRRTIRSDALKTKNVVSKSKSKINEVLHEVVDNNNNHPIRLNKEERKAMQMNNKHSPVITNGHFPKNE